MARDSINSIENTRAYKAHRVLLFETFVRNAKKAIKMNMCTMQLHSDQNEKENYSNIA